MMHLLLAFTIASVVSSGIVALAMCRLASRSDRRSAVFASQLEPHAGFEVCVRDGSGVAEVSYGRTTGIRFERASAASA